jgi:hypothetical protein
MKKYPFKFLDAYTKHDTDIFFGRDEEINMLYEMIFQNPLLLVYGASGTGKTSLIQCGLAGRFKSYDWQAITIRRGSNINITFEKLLSDACVGESAEDELPAEKKSLNQSDRIISLIKTVYVNSYKPVYLIFDQFEELYILGSKKEQEAFIETIQSVLKASLPLKMIFSIREEYLGHLFEFERAVPELLRKKLRVEPMTLEKLKEFLGGINNFKNSNVRIKPDEIDQNTLEIFNRLKGKKKTLTIQLPYLQVFLDKLYMHITNDESRQADALITKETLAGIGDIGDVLRNFLEEQVSGISRKLINRYTSATPEQIWKILSPFSTLEGTKEPISKKELSERLPDLDKNLINECIEAFVTGRILNYSENENLYELAHDSLARRIADKRSDEEIALLEVRRLIKGQAELKANAREPFTEKQLNFIEPFLDELSLGNDEKQLIAESKRSVEKQKSKKRRRLRLTFAGMSLAIIITITLASSAAIAKKRAEVERGRAERAKIVSDSLKEQAVRDKTIIQETLDKLKREQAVSKANDKILKGDQFIFDIGARCGLYNEALKIMSPYPDDPLYNTIKEKLSQFKCIK